MRLTDLSDNPGAVKKKVRVGRGIGSGCGKTAGRGVKGQTSRSGVRINGFEGGQMPIHRRLPKRGFNKPNQKVYNEVNLGVIQDAINSGKFSADTTITNELLVSSGVCSKRRDGVRILGGGTLTSKVSLRVSGASKSAVALIEALKGEVVILEQDLIA